MAGLCADCNEPPGSLKAKDNALVHKIWKRLAENSIQTAALPVSTLELTVPISRCNSNLPFYVVLSSDPETQLALQKLSELISLSRGKWLVFETPKLSFSEINVPLDSQFVAVQSSVDGVVTLTELFRIQSTMPLQRLQVAIWSENSGLVWKTDGYLKSRQNLHGLMIKAAVISDVRQLQFSMLL
ncbi:hypothetical protein ANN_19540 [Periplaneta americana]|uniref:Uncharacterized protein n=1 Tax=Periplaneta americana TaxID=6978 RepID=A0ABQ8SA51_PERAM|nr:hypothetical protein ANN_19540 [Periplaneta americana]